MGRHGRVTAWLAAVDGDQEWERRLQDRLARRELKRARRARRETPEQGQQRRAIEADVGWQRRRARFAVDEAMDAASDLGLRALLADQKLDAVDLGSDATACRAQLREAARLGSAAHEVLARLAARLRLECDA